MAQFGAKRPVFAPIKTTPDGALPTYDYEKKVNEFMDKMILPEQEGRDRITTSIGYAVYPTEGKSYERLFQKADERMYAIKKPKFKKVSTKTKNEPDPYDDDL